MSSYQDMWKEILRLKEALWGFKPTIVDRLAEKYPLLMNTYLTSFNASNHSMDGHGLHPSYPELLTELLSSMELSEEQQTTLPEVEEMSVKKEEEEEFMEQHRLSQRLQTLPSHPSSSARHMEMKQVSLMSSGRAYDMRR